MTSLTANQADLLLELLEAEERGIAATGERDRFAWQPTGGMGPTMLLHAGAHDDQAIDGLEMESLIEAGLLRQLGQRSAAFTNKGMTRAKAIQAARREAAPLDVSWEVAEKVLQVLTAAWSASGAPRLGIGVERVAQELSTDLSATARLLELLAAGGWVEMQMQGFLEAGGAGPSYTPTVQALQRFAGWPTSLETAGAFLATLDTAIEEAPDEEERSRLQELRAAAGRVSETVLGQVIGQVIATGQLPHL